LGERAVSAQLLVRAVAGDPLVLHVGLDERGEVALFQPDRAHRGHEGDQRRVARAPGGPDRGQVGAERLQRGQPVRGRPRVVAEVVDHPDDVVHGAQMTAHRSG